MKTWHVSHLTRHTLTLLLIYFASNKIPELEIILRCSFIQFGSIYMHIGDGCVTGILLRLGNRITTQLVLLILIDFPISVNSFCSF